MEKSTSSINPQGTKLNTSVSSLDPQIAKLKGKGINTSAVSSILTGSEKPLPNYMRASTNSCHHACKYGGKHEFEGENKHQVPRKLVRNSSIGDDKYQKNNSSQEKLSEKLRSSSLKNVEFSDKSRIILQKATSQLKESSPTEQANISDSSGDTIQENTVKPDKGKKKQLLKSKSVPNPNTSRNKSAISQKASEQKNRSSITEMEAHVNSHIPEKKTTSSFPKASSSMKPKLFKQTSANSLIVPDKSQNSKHSILTSPRVINSATSSSPKMNRKQAAKFESSLSPSNSLTAKNMGVTSISGTKGSTSSSTLGSKLAGNHKSLSKPKKVVTGKAGSSNITDVDRDESNNNNNERVGNAYGIQQELQKVNIIDSYFDITADTRLVPGKEDSDSYMQLQSGDVIEIELENADQDDLQQDLLADIVDLKIMKETLPIPEDYDSFFQIQPQEQNADIDSSEQDELSKTESLDVDRLQQIPYDDQSSQELTERENISVNSLQQKPIDDPGEELSIPENISLHSSQQEDIPIGNDIIDDFVMQECNEDQVFDQLTKPENIYNEGCIQEKPEESQSSHELPNPDDILMDSLQNLEGGGNIHSDYAIQKLPIACNANLHPEENAIADLEIPQEELQNSESIILETEVKSEQIFPTQDNVDLDIPEQETKQEENTADEKPNHKETSESMSAYEEEMEETYSEYTEESESENDDIHEHEFDYIELDKNNNNDNGYESKYEESKYKNQKDSVDSSMVAERRTRRKGILHSDVSSSKPYKLKFRRGKVIEAQPEHNSPKKLKFRRRRILENGGDDEPGRDNCRKKAANDDVVIDPDLKAKAVILRHQDVQEKKGTANFNNVIEETASKLVETKKSKVKALVGAFETVMTSLQDGKPASTS